MVVDPHPEVSRSGAMMPLAPGPLITIAQGPLSVDIAPAAGGRVAQMIQDGIEWLVGHDEGAAAMIAWGSYPMVPWAGRLRRGGFGFDGRRYRLPPNLGDHAIHGVGFGMPWRVEAHAADHAELSLMLPDDGRWPFGGVARQRFDVGEGWIRMALSVTAGARAMPVTLGWHPWFRKPDRIEFSPTAMYPRDEEGIAALPLVVPSPGPWDDCFINEAPVIVHRGEQRVRLTSDCSHWVIYDETGHATCIEPQSGPPDAFNLAPRRLAPSASCEFWFLLEWL